MADIIDQAQDRINIETERILKKATAYKGKSSLYCHQCGEPIPEARRQAVQGCSLCIYCQQIEETRGRHGQR